MLLWYTCLLHTLYSSIYCIIFCLKWPSVCFFFSFERYKIAQKEEMANKTIQMTFSKINCGTLKSILIDCFKYFAIFVDVTFDISVFEMKFKRSDSLRVEQMKNEDKTVSISREPRLVVVYSNDWYLFYLSNRKIPQKLFYPKLSLAQRKFCT